MQQIFPGIVVGLFDDPILDEIVVQTFTAFAEVRTHHSRDSRAVFLRHHDVHIVVAVDLKSLQIANLLSYPVTTDSILVKISSAIRQFIPLIKKYFATLGVKMPDALTVHMLHHYPDSIPKFGTPRNTSTETNLELPHKYAVKKPAKRASKREAFEVGAFRHVVSRDAMTRHFAFLATYHPHLIRDRSWGAELDALVTKIDSVRHLKLPAVPLEYASYKARGGAVKEPTRSARSGVGDRDELDEDGGDDEDSDEDDDEEDARAGGKDEDELDVDEFDPFTDDLDLLIELIEENQARQKRRGMARKRAARVDQLDASLGQGGDAADAASADSQGSGVVAVVGDRLDARPGEIPVRMLGSVTLRFKMPRYRRRAHGVSLNELEFKFPDAAGLSEALARFTLKNCVDPYVCFDSLLLGFNSLA